MEPCFNVPVLAWRGEYPVVEVFLGPPPHRLADQLKTEADVALKLAPITAWLRPDVLESATTTAILTLLGWALDLEEAEADPLPVLLGSVVLQDPDQPGILAPVPIELRADERELPEDIHLVLGQDVLCYFDTQPLEDNRIACTLRHGTEPFVAR
ncbi:MAG: hypothetical protein SFY70_12720 [Bacteroidia bacterium]|nr:hypothetical protein [Bacteroidia bacterium]